MDIHKQKVKYILIMNNIEINNKLNLSFFNSTAVICVQKHHKILDTIAKFVKIMIYVVNALFKNVPLNMIMKQLILKKLTKQNNFNLIKKMKSNKTKKINKKHSL